MNSPPTSGSNGREQSEEGLARGQPVRLIQDFLLTSLRLFYNQPSNAAALLDVLQQKSNYPSLRILDWLVTNYSRTRNVNHCTVDAKGNRRQMSISTNYRLQLKAYSKRRFDPFCRRERIVFPLVDPREVVSAPASRVLPGDAPRTPDGDLTWPEEGWIDTPVNESRLHNLITTVGQLNFFRWAISNDILSFATAHRKEIEQDMIISAREKDHRTRSKGGVAAVPAETTCIRVARCRNRTITMSFR
jgi:hypothetical protein